MERKGPYDSIEEDPVHGFIPLVGARGRVLSQVTSCPRFRPDGAGRHHAKGSQARDHSLEAGGMLRETQRDISPSEPSLRDSSEENGFPVSQLSSPALLL